MKYVLLLVMSFGLTGCFGMHYSEGERTGHVVKFSKKGFFFKTWEGEMNIGGMKDGEGTMMIEKFRFTVPENGPIAEVQEVVRSGEKATLEYDQNTYFFTFNGDTDYFIKVVKK